MTAMTEDPRTGKIRPMTPEEITAATARAKAALDGDRQWRQEQSLDGNFNGGMCEVCNHSPATKRTLCENCYRSQKRAGYLDEYATADYMDNPESHIYWALKYHPEVIADIAHRFGITLVKETGWTPKVGRPGWLGDTTPGGPEV